MLIKEIILENFMSYEYARIPFKSGVNVVCGPNGAGKSSVLLGISVALGQSYTERSRKLSDLIRRGKDQARITLVLDNSHRKGRRPVQKFDRDYVYLTRYLRSDGKYWFELENHAAIRNDVTSLLSKFGIDPENMLVIMHQNMVEQFTVLSSQEKLKMFESAVGFESFRRDVLEAQKKLNRILSQEESVGKLLESAEQTMTYWREQYERYQQKKQLLIKRRFLERELAWAEVSKREKAVSDLKSEIGKQQNEILQIEGRTKVTEEQMGKLQKTLNKSKIEGQELINQRLTLEREITKHKTNITLSNQNLKEIISWVSAHQEEIRSCVGRTELLEKRTHANQIPNNLKSQLSEIQKSYENFITIWNNRFNSKIEKLKKLIISSDEQITRLEFQAEDVQKKANHLNLEAEATNNSILDSKINVALLKYQKENISNSVEKLSNELRTLLSDAHNAKINAEETGLQVVTTRSSTDILNEIRLTDGYVAAFADASEDVERMYESYSKLYLELKEKALVVSENREKALVEVKTRIEAWRNVVQDLLNRVNLQYQAILTEAQASGEVQLINKHDIEAAGLEVYVGFKGVKSVPLNSYTQSGGERSTATMAFLLALQHYVRSPFRAVDEYDIHMDPRNREIIANLLISSVAGSDAQYLAITPSQIVFKVKDVNVITVQNVEGASVVKGVV